MTVLTLFLRLSFKLVTEATSLSDYARTGGRLALLVMRAVNAGGEVDVLGIKEVPVIDLGVADDIVEDEEFEKIFARVREEEEEDDDDEDGYEDGYEDAGTDVFDEDTNVEPEINHEDVNHDADFGDDYPILLSTEQRDAASCFHAALENDKPDNELLKLFHHLFLSIFTSQPFDAEKRRFHLPVEAFILGSSLDVDGSIRGPGSIASRLSKLQYDAQFSILYDALTGDCDVSKYVL